MNTCTRSIIITGVSGGMGAATARRLQKEGFRVFGLDIREPSEKLTGVHYIWADLTDDESVKNAFQLIREQTDSVNAIIHMAGMYDLNSLVEIPEEEFSRIFQINLFSVYRVNKTFLPILKENSRVIITSSELAPLDPLPFTGLYAVTKAALEKYAYALRMELQLLGHKVIVIRPGAVDTRFIDISTDRLDAFCNGTELYSYNAEKFREIVDWVEARKIAPERIADIAYKAVTSSHPRFIYKINRNPLLLLLNLLPDRLQTAIIKTIVAEDPSVS